MSFDNDHRTILTICAYYTSNVQFLTSFYHCMTTQITIYIFNIFLMNMFIVYTLFDCCVYVVRKK